VGKRREEWGRRGKEEESKGGEGRKMKGDERERKGSVYGENVCIKLHCRRHYCW